ncbi:MAG: PfkB family carbohydrate kinase [Actinomycetota bacterium]|nr:PfkB family carbohydrate kinase [Actinomycetota bacterium]
MRAAVVGHVEWVTFMRVDHTPKVGDIVHAREWWEQPGGGGAGAAVQLAKLCGSCDFYTALGDDELGKRARNELSSLGVRVHAAVRNDPTRRAVTHVDEVGERTITVLGRRLEPAEADPLPWDQLARVDAVYFTAGDVGALRRARSARFVVATARVLSFLQQTGVQLDALVSSANDPGEAYADGDLDPAPGLVIRTDGDKGGTYATTEGPTRPYAPVEPPRPIVDRYGAGDSFAAGVTYALGAGMAPEDVVAFAARCGAWVITGRGPFEAQLVLERSDADGTDQSSEES